MKLVEEVFSLSFAETPNYGKLKHLLVNELLRTEKVPNNVFSWSKFKSRNVIDLCDESIDEGEISENLSKEIILSCESEVISSRFFSNHVLKIRNDEDRFKRKSKDFKSVK